MNPATNVITNLNPAVLIYATIALCFFLRRILPKKKAVQEILKCTILYIPIVLLIAKLAVYEPIAQYPFVLRRDWFSTVLFGKLDSSSVISAIALLCISLLLVVSYTNSTFLVCVRSIAHIGGAIGLVFANNAMGKLFYCEIIAVITIGTVLSDRKLGKKNHTIYAMTHLLASTLSLCGLVAIISVPSIQDISYFGFNLQSILIPTSLLIILGCPPFNFALVDIYGDTNYKNTALQASILSKFFPLVFLPLLPSLPANITPIIGFIMIFYTFFRVLKEKSLAKTILLWTVVHSGMLLSVTSIDININGAQLSLYLALVSLSTFYVFSAITVLLRHTPSPERINKNIIKIKELKRTRLFFKNTTMFALLLMVFGTPYSISYFADTLLYQCIEPEMYQRYIIVFGDIVSIFIGWKLIFAYFGFWSKPKSSTNAELGKEYSRISHKTKIKFCIKTTILAVTGIWMSCMCIWLEQWMLGLVGISGMRLHRKEYIEHYLTIFLSVGIIYAMVLKLLRPKTEMQFTESKPILMTVAVHSKISTFISSGNIIVKYKTNKYSKRTVVLTKAFLRKISFNVFSSYYSSERCISTACIFASLLTIIAIMHK